jgi:hypothetical protein
MQPDSPALPWHELRRLHHGLATAPDLQIAKVVAVVDALESRGAADEMIEPLRSRLPQLRLPRPLRFSRLLFMPLDVLIVANPAWRRDASTIPRSIVAPVADMLQNAMGGDAAVIEGAIKGRTTAHIKVVYDAGRALWSAASGILGAATRPPPNWAKTHLPTDCFVPLARRLATLFAQNDTLDAMVAEADIGVSLRADLIVPMLTACSKDTSTLAMMVTLILARLPGVRRLLAPAARSLGGGHEAAMQTAIDQALEVLMQRLEARNGIETLVVGGSLRQAAGEVRRIKALLDGLLRNRLRDDWPSRLVQMKIRLDVSCRLRFAIALEVEFADALRALDNDSEQVVVNRLEEVAVHLRNLEKEAVQIDSREGYDMLLREAAEHIKAAALAGALGVVDCVRLVEILVGSDEALALLDEADGVGA